MIAVKVKEWRFWKVRVINCLAGERLMAFPGDRMMERIMVFPAGWMVVSEGEKVVVSTGDIISDNIILLGMLEEDCTSIDVLPVGLRHCTCSRLGWEYALVSFRSELRKEEAVELFRLHFLSQSTTMHSFMLQITRSELEKILFILWMFLSTESLNIPRQIIVFFYTDTVIFSPITVPLSLCLSVFISACLSAIASLSNRKCDSNQAIDAFKTIV